MDNIQARINFVDKVMKGQYSRAEAEAELDRMEQEFGERAFTTGKVTRKSKPWSMEDLKDLERDFMASASSRKFFEYMAEMSEEVYRKKRQRKKLAIFGGIAAAIALVVAVVALVRLFHS
ncbi:hypothetical protein [Flavonifractor sp. An100]|uniref:hypothetical protein n=1 Tax=Flavonifractor sp. An100 TaxID=1965538 RepID=UPI000B3A40F4|nr:hypothetical protein [Flavonifractor sp. An100]OUQ76582.1 hypothetical protein B5E43_11655 [Flavonifractor sp. An100]